MSNSTRLALPFIDAAQSQKHVTHNEALVALDGLVHLAVKARNIAAPPASAVDGDRYLVPSGATGVFAGHGNAVASFDASGWAFLAPRAGWRAFVESENLFLVFDGASWKDVGLSLQNLQNLSRLGVGASADAANPLLAKLNSALLTARSSSEGGTGDLRVALNKSASGNTVSQLYQTNFSGRAETGLAGDDRFRIKVSPDGSIWRDALSVDPASGLVSLPRTAGFANGLATLDGGGAIPLAQIPAAALRSYLAGFAIANNPAAPQTKIDVAAGMAADSANTALISASAGSINCLSTGANGLDAGALAANSWYHVFVIAGAGGVAAFLASLSVDAPVLPSGFSAFRRLGSFRTDAAAAILAFQQNEDVFRWTAAVTDVATSSMGATSALYALTVPTGVKVRPIADLGATVGVLLVFNGDETGYAPGTSNISNAPGWMISGGVNQSQRFSNVFTNTSAQVRIRSGGVSTSLYIYTRGWIDTRGRLN